jgi:hypothetical protein
MKQRFDDMLSWLILAGFYVTFSLAARFFSQPPITKDSAVSGKPV